MDKFLEKIGAALEALNTSVLWGYIQSVVGKLVKLLDLEKETEAADIIKDIFAAE